ncbi:MAG: metallophosphoesterase family protein [Clostridia bacterium]|nr:metallophosphoesterase family protein [Clostridia bacterium]
MFYFQKPTGGLYYGKKLLNAPHVTQNRIGIPARTVFVSDIHLRKNQETLLDRLTAQIRELQPELLLFGGDISEYNDGILQFVSEMKNVHAKYGIFAVCGNNDSQRFDWNPEQLKIELSKGGVTLLLNECARIPLENGKHMEIAGLKDAYFHEPQLTGLFSKENDVFRVLLSHMPLKKFVSETDVKPNLMLSGHTHGGQINVLGLTCYELLNYEGKYQYTHLSGEKQFGDTLVIVSNGIGTSKYPVRFGARPEIHLIT